MIIWLLCQKLKISKGRWYLLPNKGINLVVNLQGKQEAIKQLDEIMKYSNKELKINISKDSINSLQTFKNLLNEIKERSTNG